MRTFSGRSIAANGDAVITAVPAAGLPNITSLVSRSDSPAVLACWLWSITANSIAPAALIACFTRSTASSTEYEQPILTIPAALRAAGGPSVPGSGIIMIVSWKVPAPRGKKLPRWRDPATQVPREDLEFRSADGSARRRGPSVPR
jgi:hypothetical protein